MLASQASDALEAAAAEILTVPELGHTLSLLVAHRGELVFERYFGPAGPTDLHNLHSVTKSFVSTLVGILVGDGFMSLDAPVATLLPGPRFDEDPAKAGITVHHLLTMTSGLDASGPFDLDEISDRGEPWVDGVLRAPLITPPGSSFFYSNGASHLLSAVIREVTARPVADVAAERLFAPLGIDRWQWDTDPQGLHQGCSDLRVVPRDLVKLGQIYLDGGRWNGTKVLDQDWVRAATSPLTAGGPPEGCSYGRLWWVDHRAASPRYFAGGWGGQYVLVVPELDLVIVTTADSYAGPRPQGFLLRRLAQQTIIPAFAPGGGP